MNIKLGFSRRIAVRFYFQYVSNTHFLIFALQKVVDIKIPENMPLSSRMMNKGYSSMNLTEDRLMNMDFGYGGGRDSPTNGDEGGGKKNVGGSRTSNRDDKSSRVPSRATPNSKGFQPAFKKHHTVA